MPGTTQPSSKKTRRPIAAGGIGVLTGVGLSTGLFGTIGMAKIFGAPSGFSTAYPLVIFCLAALFLLTAALMTIQVTQEQRRFAYVGMGCFALIATVGVSILFWQDFRTPTVTITEIFEPSDLLGAATSPDKLQLLYRAINGKAVEYAPYTNAPLSIRGGDVISFRMDGLSDLVQNYRSVRAQSETQTQMLKAVCKEQPNNFYCAQINDVKALPL